jgi:shikimate kinase
MAKTNNIILIGFMGVGKGRTARALAEKTGLYTVDTDDLIETMVKMKIRDIFAIHGEPRFRELEQRTADWVRKNVRNTVVSTGGGFYQVKKLRKIGTVIYLHSSVEAIIEAILAHPNAKKKIKKRPLLQDLDKARDLYAKRLPQYRRLAHMEVEVQGRAMDEVADNILAQLAGRKK